MSAPGSTASFDDLAEDFRGRYADADSLYYLETHRTGSRKNAVYLRLERWLPAGLRDGTTAVLVPANRRARSGV
jgi:hypothetical protein